MNKEKILMEALKLAVEDVNKLWKRLSNGIYIPYYTEDYIMSAQQKLSSEEE